MKAYPKVIIRSVFGSLSRFGSIFAIAALGVGILAGLLASTPDMKDTMEAHYDQMGLMDLRILSTVGLAEEDLTALREFPGIAGVRGGKNADMVVQAGDDARIAVTIHALHGQEAAFSGLELISGRWPENPGECLVEAAEGGVNHNFALGSTVTVLADNENWEDTLARREYTVVGTVGSPYYMSMDRETTSVGAGIIQGILYLPEEAFVTDYYTTLWLWLEGGEAMHSFHQEYKDYVEQVTDALEELSGEQKWVRYNQIKAEVDDKINDAKQELADAKADGEKELADAAREIADGEKEIADGEKELADAAKEIADGEKELADAAQEIADGEKELADGEKELADALKEITDGEKELADGEREIADARAELDDAKQQLADGLKELEDGKAELEDAKTQIEDGWKQWRAGIGGILEGEQQLAEAKAQLDSAKAQIEDGRAQLGQGKATLEQGKNALPMLKQLEAANHPMLPGILAQYGCSSVAQLEQLLTVTEQQLAASEQQLAAAEAQYQTGLAEYTAGVRELEEMKGLMTYTRIQLEDAEKQYEEGLLEYQDGLREYEENYQKYLDGEQEYADGLAQLEDARKKLADGKAEYQDGLKTLEEARADLAQGKLDYQEGLQELADGKKEYQDGLRELEDARKKLADGKKEYQDGLKEFDEEIAKAEKKIADAEADAAEALAEEPEWYILGRDMAISTASFESNADKVANIARVFPIFFFAIATLVSLTTMTRMVDEERGQIGTLKSLGYSGGAIAAKYLLYAAAASLSGAVVGMALCFRLFPRVLWAAYDIMYRLPPLQTPWRWDLALVITGVTVGAILLATGSTVYAALKEKPAALMQPKAPPPGKRILLERVTFVWKKLPFTWKVTARNLFRYKKRMLMTVIGVAGCTALLLTGFGLQDSITDIIQKQFSEIYRHNVEIDLTEEWQGDAALAGLLADESRIDRYLPVYQAGLTAVGDGVQTDLQLKVPADSAKMLEHFDLRDRVTGTPLVFDDNAVILTEKAALTLGIGVGDTLTVRDDGVERHLTVTGVAENYIKGFLYAGKSAWEQATGSELPEYNLMMAQMKNEPAADIRAALGEDVLRCDGAASITFVLQAAKTYSDMLTAINAIVVVLILAAGILAFVVLYNLTNINVCERIKEIATLKVLGFYQSETAAYVFRETIILSLLGGLVGLGAGIFLEKFVVLAAEVDMVMFGREIKPDSFAWSLALTMVFACVVSLAMNKRLKNISMVESMKAPE